MTITALASQLLLHFAPEERSIPDSAPYTGRNAAVMTAINGAVQEAWSAGGPWVRYDERGYLVNAPTSVTVSVTNGSTAATISSGWAAWMAGCTIAIDGSDTDNQIRNASSSAVLKYPYNGTTGSKSATVYHDSITIGDDVQEILEPVRFDRRAIVAVPSGNYPFSFRADEDYGFEGALGIASVPDRVGQTIGRVAGWAVESWSLDATTAPKTRMRLLPAPDSAGTLDHRAQLAPPFVTDLASTSTLPIPLQWVQSIIYPLARKRLSGSAFYQQGPDPGEVERSYQEALRILRGLNPRPQSGTRIRSIY